LTWFRHLGRLELEGTVKKSAVDEQKRALRDGLRDHFAQITAGERAFLSRQAMVRLAKAPWLRKIEKVLLYAALNNELNPASAIQFLLPRQLSLPRYDQQTQRYCAARYSGQPKELVMGKFKIPEPTAETPCIPLKELDLVLVPGVAFDRAGRRLGRGRGFYDRLLAEVRGIKCGVAYDWQVVGELPEEPHDIKMDFVLTPSQLFSTGATPGLA
jgi:5-formyltetrahydrofolate cyclo-ligase